MAKDLAGAVLCALAYSDVFDAALTPREIYRYLPLPATWEEVERTLAGLSRDAVRVERSNGYVALAGRGALTRRRERRERRASALWPEARLQARRLARLPFVRMVGLTGALAARTPLRDDDLDYFLVTAEGRVWLARALAIAVVRVARRRGVEVCPNYLVSTRARELPGRGLFAARELYQMIPLYGYSTYLALMRVNPWAREHLPNAHPQPERATVRLSRGEAAVKRLGELLLEGRLGDRLEGLERQRKIRKLSARGRAEWPAVVLDREVCKGHFHDYGRLALEGYGQRLQRLGLEG